MEYTKTPYFRVGSSADLSGSDRTLYRFFELIPGILSWGTILVTLFLSYRFPTAAAVLLIAFNLYWVLKSFYLSIHLRQNWRHVRYNMALDWNERLLPMRAAADGILHLVIFPYYKESPEVIEKSIQSLLDSTTDPKKFAVVLAGEARAGDEAAKNGADAARKFAGKFGHFLLTSHPADLPGDIPGKGSNIAYACSEAKRLIVDAKNISVENVLVSAFDIDTVIYPQYFSCLEWHFLTAPDRFRASYQPVPLYNNNMWHAPALSRVVATSGSFWQMIQQERPERLTTFSSHSMTLKALVDTDYWQRNIVSEDSRIFWNAFAAYDSRYAVVPMSYPVSMDANLADSFWKTLRNVYLQQRRWSWGVENLPYMLMIFARNPDISRGRKIRLAALEIERAWSLSTNPLLLFILAWFPILIGGHHFNTTILAYNLPVISKYLSFIGTIGILVSAWISLTFLPPPPSGKSERLGKIWMFAQWFFIPVTLIVFGSIPALESQTRLMLGGKFRLGFWVTPKHRKT